MEIEPGEGLGRQQDRHAVAGLFARLSLRTRLSLLVGFIVALVVGAAAFLELRMFTVRMERELIESARVTARAVADDVELRSRTDEDAVEAAVLHEFLEVNPAVRSITVVRMDGDTPTVVLSTSTEERPAALNVAHRAMAAGDEMDQSAGLMRFVGVPFVGPRDPMAVVVAVSTLAVERVSRDGRLLALWVMLPAILIVIVLLDWLARRLVHRRLGDIRETMRRVADGDLRARAAVERPDEIGAIVSGLNNMLSEMEVLSDSLQTRVRDATAELRARNADVEEMYQRVFDLREALAKAEQLAAVGQAAANVAHQVGTPLNLVSGYVQILLSDASLDTQDAAAARDDAAADRAGHRRGPQPAGSRAAHGAADRGRAVSADRSRAGNRPAAARSQSRDGRGPRGARAAKDRGGHGAARARLAEPRDQRHRRDGRRREAHADPLAHRRQHPPGSGRQRTRRAGRPDPHHLRAVGHHEAVRAGHRPGPGDRAEA